MPDGPRAQLLCYKDGWNVKAPLIFSIIIQCEGTE